jgi:hypothetical protein
MEFGDLRPLLERIIADIQGIRRNTNNAGCCVADTSASGSTSIPAGFGSVSIVLLSGTATITLSDGSTYPLTTTGEVFTDVAPNGDSLPAYTITGSGTWKWHGIK